MATRNPFTAQKIGDLLDFNLQESRKISSSSTQLSIKGTKDIQLKNFNITRGVISGSPQTQMFQTSQSDRSEALINQLKKSYKMDWLLRSQDLSRKTNTCLQIFQQKPEHYFEMSKQCNKKNSFESLPLFLLKEKIQQEEDNALKAKYKQIHQEIKKELDELEQYYQKQKKKLLKKLEKQMREERRKSEIKVTSRMSQLVENNINELDDKENNHDGVIEDKPKQQEKKLKSVLKNSAEKQSRRKEKWLNDDSINDWQFLSIAKSQLIKSKSKEIVDQSKKKKFKIFFRKKLKKLKEQNFDMTGINNLIFQKTKEKDFRRSFNSNF